MTAEAIDHPQAFVGRGSALYLRFDAHALAPDKVGDARTNDPHVALDRPQARRQHERPRPGHDGG